MCSLPDLLQLCINSVALSLPLDKPPSTATLPDEALAIQIFDAYIRVDQARRRTPQVYNFVRHVAALRQLASLWQPAVLKITVPCLKQQQQQDLTCDELQMFSCGLQHLEVASLCAARRLSGLQGLHRLTCLSLRNCPNLTTNSVIHALQQLPQLRSLDLCGLRAASDDLAPTLVSLSNLEVLQLNYTACSDVTVEWLTYGDRLFYWSKASAGQLAGQASSGPAGHGAPSAAAVSHHMSQWPRCKIRFWHLAYTRVSPKAVDLLSSCAEMMLLDLRGSGVKAAQLAALRAKHAMSAVQGAVLSRTAAMVLASVTLGQFVCADAVQHSAAACEAASAADSRLLNRGRVTSQQVITNCVNALLQAVADV